MQVLTGVVLAAFVAYIGGWYFGEIEGNFALLLFVSSVVTGLYWLAERFYFLPKRQQAALTLAAQTQLRREAMAQQGIAATDLDVTQAKERLLMQPWWLDWTAGLFPVIVTVFLLRSFLFEPFKIPSGSMIPTLYIGDLILVNKFHYGLRLPVLNTKLTQGEPVQRGDVMVFRYPVRPSQDYIKRVVGIPGDEVAYINKRLTINGQPVPTESVPEFFDESTVRYFKQYEEVLGSVRHRLIQYDERRAGFSDFEIGDFPFREHCHYSAQGVVCKVPPGHYFMMGDNRDNSQDSRYWGFVPDQNIVGKAVFIWMNFGHLGRFGAFH